MKNIFFGGVFLIVLLLAFFQRWEGITNERVLFLFDSARDAFLAKEILFNNELYLIGPPSGGITGYFHGVLWIYLLTIPLFLGQGAPIALTIFVAICSLVATLLAFFVLKRTVNIYAAWIGLLLYAFGVFNVSTSRFTWNPFPVVWLMPLYFLCFYWSNKGKKYALLGLSLLTSLFIHFEAVYGVCLLIPLAYFGFTYLRHKRIKEVFLAIGVFFIPILPSVVFDLRHNFLISQSLLTAFFSGGDTLTHSGAAKPFLERMAPRLSDFFNHTIFLTKNMYVDLFVLGLVVVGSIKMKEKKFLYLISGTLLIPFFFFLLFKYEVWSYYWIGNAPLYAMFASFVLGTWLAKKRLAIILLGMLLFVTMNPIQDIVTHKDGYVGEGTTTLSTQRSLVKDIYQDAGTEPFSVYVLTPPIYDYHYQYLFWYESKILKRAAPLREKQKLVYVILEKDPADPKGKGTHLKQQVLRLSGSPTAVSTYPDGIRVEKFITDQQPAVDYNYFNDL